MIDKLLLNAIEADVHHMVKYSHIHLEGITSDDVYLFDIRPTPEGIRVVFTMYNKKYNTMYANFKIAYKQGRLVYVFEHGAVEKNGIDHPILWIDGILKIKEEG